jgi:hypothetical protein
MGRKCIFLGYRQGVKGIVLYDLHSKEILISRHVVHHDHILPYKPCTSTTPSWNYHTNFTPSISQPELLASQEISSDTPPSTPTNVDPVTIANDNFPTDPIDTSTDITPSQMLNENQNIHVTSNYRPVRVRQTPFYLLILHPKVFSIPFLIFIHVIFCPLHIMHTLCPSHTTQNLTLFWKHAKMNNGYML